MNNLIEEGYDFDNVMLVPRKCIVKSREEISLSTVLALNPRTGQELVLSNPIVSANMETITGKDLACEMSRLGGAGILHRFAPEWAVLGWISEMSNDRIFPIIPSIGCGDEWLSTTKHYIDKGADAICIDVANAYSEQVIEMLKKLTQLTPEMFFIVGNIATDDAAKELINAGASALKVGIGSGYCCTTRRETGVGVPQLSAIANVVSIANQRNIPVMSDGGARVAGDIVKALAAGASSVMSGYFFTGTSESLSHTEYRGNASREAKLAHGLKDCHIEGKSISIEFKGPVEPIVQHLLDGIRSGISYVGGRNIKELQFYAKFVSK